MVFRYVVVFAMLFAVVPSSGLAQSVLPGFERTGQFDEQVKWTRLESGVRVLVTAGVNLKAGERLLVVYATPNGNTLEQTLGCAATKGLDWHFDIQHVAAQIRRLREVDRTRDVFLAVVQAPGLSWPAFNRDQSGAGQIITGLVSSLTEQCKADSVVLSCHSGGGSFVLNYLNAFDAIPPLVERIVLLDANYSYSDEMHHGDKLLAWLDGDPRRHLVTIAYDDREITFNGKKVVGPTGGTFRASERMLARFGRDLQLTDAEFGPFRHVTGRNGQTQFFVHPNPENKILHTALVGEMNGLLHGLTLGTELEGKWGRFGGPRAYTSWIQPRPFEESPVAPQPMLPEEGKVCLALPDRPADAPTGSEFQRRIAELPLDRREATVVEEIRSGNVPSFLRRLKPIELTASDETGTRHTGTCYVTCDYLAVGTDDDFFRVPLTPKAAVAIADSLDCTLLTAKISDAVHAAADVKLQPRPLTQDRETVATFFEHHQLIEGQLLGKKRGLMVAGIKKDVVLTNRLKEKPRKVAIYGWHYAGGKPIQPLYVGHWDRYVDYSHGIRLLAGEMTVDGETRRVLDVLNDERLCELISDEGPIDAAKVRRASDWER